MIPLKRENRYVIQYTSHYTSWIHKCYEYNFIMFYRPETEAEHFVVYGNKSSQGNKCNEICTIWFGFRIFIETIIIQLVNSFLLTETCVFFNKDLKFYLYLTVLYSLGIDIFQTCFISHRTILAGVFHYYFPEPILLMLKTSFFPLSMYF